MELTPTPRIVTEYRNKNKSVVHQNCCDIFGTERRMQPGNYNNVIVLIQHTITHIV